MPPNPNRNAPGDEGEKRTKVGHSVGRAGIGGNVYLQVGWESLPSPFLSLSRSASVFHMFRFLSRRERQHMGPNFHPTGLSPFHSHPVSQSTSVVAAAAATWNSIEKKRKTQWAECWNRPSGGAAAIFFRLFLTDRVNCRWRRLQCGSVAAHPLRWESPPFRTKAQNAELLSLLSLFLSPLALPCEYFLTAAGNGRHGGESLTDPEHSSDVRPRLRRIGHVFRSALTKNPPQAVIAAACSNLFARPRRCDGAAGTI